jgi:CPA1 family monovalent cation:H+ antiporter
VRLRHAEHDVHDDSERQDAEIARIATAAERKRLLELRRDETIGDAAFQQIEQELDWKELDLEQVVSRV